MKPNSPPDQNGKSADDGFAAPVYDAPMNRIREIRKARGMSADHLAELCGTTHQQILRLESGERRLTVEWIQRIAQGLGVTPADLLNVPTTTTRTDDAVLAREGFAAVSEALSAKGIRIYKVLTDVVADAGYPMGAVVTVDETQDAISRKRDGDLLLLEFTAASGQKCLMLRQHLGPSLITTNRPGANAVDRLDDPALDVKILGVVIRQ